MLHLLVDNSERASRTLHRPLAPAEQEDLYAVFRRVGDGLGIPALPADYAAWQVGRAAQLERDLAAGPYTAALYAAYRRALGGWRSAVLWQVQGALAPERVRALLDLPRRSWAGSLFPAYGALTRSGLRPLAQCVLVPAAHLAAVRRLDRLGTAPASHACDRGAATRDAVA